MKPIIARKFKSLHFQKVVSILFASRPLIVSATVFVTVLLLARAKANTLEIHMRINQDVEDIAEQEWGGNHFPGRVSKGDIELDLGMRNTADYSDEPVDVPQRIALLFRNVDIPVGSTINSANIQFTVHDNDSTIWTPDNDPEVGALEPLEASVSIYGLLDADPADLPRLSICNNFGQCATDTLYTLTNLTGGQCEGGNCPTFGTGPMGGIGPDISNVTAPVHWEDIPTWTNGAPNYENIKGAAGPDQLTPDLSSILQEIIELEGWTPNNSMVFMIDPMFLGVDEITGEDLYARGGRNAVSFCTFPEDDGSLCDPPLEPPILLIDFTPPSALAGDFDDDGDVDGFDFMKWQRGQSPNPLSALDLADWETKFGSTSGLAATANVPEPSTLLLVALTAVGRLMRRR